jgi:hypothetical protein
LARDWPALVEKNSQVSEPRKSEMFGMVVRSHIPDAREAVIQAFTWRARDGAAVAESDGALLVEIAARADAEEAFHLLQFVEWSNHANLAWAIRILETLPIRELLAKPERDRLLPHLLTALLPYRRRPAPLPRSTIQFVLKQLISVPELDIDVQSREWSLLVKDYPREMFDLVRERIAYRASLPAATRYRPVPHGYPVAFDLSALAKETDYAAICDELWERVLKPVETQKLDWLKLFQAVVRMDAALWVPRMLTAIEAASSWEALRWLAQLLKFEGSLIIFRFPEITRAFLLRARALGGDELWQTIWAELYSACGPLVRSYSEGILNKQSDYVEAEAARAAEAHASDALLGPFYRWIVSNEQQQRLRIRMVAQAESAALD